MQRSLHRATPRVRKVPAAPSRAAARADLRTLTGASPPWLKSTGAAQLATQHRAAMAPPGPPPHIPCAGGPAARRPQLPKRSGRFRAGRAATPGSSYFGTARWPRPARPDWSICAWIPVFTRHIAGLCSSLQTSIQTRLFFARVTHSGAISRFSGLWKSVCDGLPNCRTGRCSGPVSRMNSVLQARPRQCPQDPVFTRHMAMAMLLAQSAKLAGVGAGCRPFIRRGRGPDQAGS